MRSIPVKISVVAALLSVSSAATAQQTIKIGLILPYSGQFADTATQMDNGIKLYVQKHGDTIAGKKLEFVRKDSGGVAPDVAKRLAQELVVRDRIDILAGFVLSPNTLAVADVSEQARKPMVVMNAGASLIMTKSPYAVRVSVTLNQVAEAFGGWAAKAGIKKSYTMVSDFAPGHDAEIGFQRAFKEGGGEIVGSVRFPVANPDFSPFIQRAKDLAPESIFLFVPAGAQPAAFGKALAERGVDPKVVKVLGTGETTAEPALKSMGDAALGIITAWHYDHADERPLNKEFVSTYFSAYGRNPDFLSLGGYDGMHLIYEALRKTGGNPDAGNFIAASKGLTWESPRGPITIEPEFRDVVQTIYVRRVERSGSELRNIIIDKVDNVRDPVLARLKR